MLSLCCLCFLAGAKEAGPIEPLRVVTLQHEAPDPATGRYDWGPSVMLDDDGLHKMWWVRLGGSGQERRFPFDARLPGGGVFSFTYPDWGDRIYCAASRDGVTWHLEGPEYTGDPAAFGPDSPGLLLALGPAEAPGEINHVGTPSVMKVRGTYYLYYEAPADFHAELDAEGRPRLVGEYHNQVFVATSADGKTWTRRPVHARPRPVIAAPSENLEFGRQRYGFGQPSAFYENGRFVLHYVDSCTGPGDFVVRVESEDPYFHNARAFARKLTPATGADDVPDGAVARFAQMDVKPLDGAYYLLRPAYGTGRLGLLASHDGVFEADADATMPTEVFPQIRVPDPRGEDWLEVLYPRFLTDPTGRIFVRDGVVSIYYSSGRGWKDDAFTWDVFRCEVAVGDLRRVLSR